MNIKNLFSLKTLKSKFKLFLGSALAVAIFSVLFQWYLTIPAIFVIPNQTLKFSEPIIIKATNSKANKSNCLNVKFDDTLFEKQAFPKECKDYQIWHFILKNQKYSPDMKKPGKHKIKVGFPGEVMSEEFAI